MNKETLLQETIRIVNESGLSLQVICKDTGLKVRWLHKLLCNDFSDPGVNKIELLNKYIKSMEVK